MLSRRTLLGAAGVTLAGVTAGCLDQVPFVGGEPLAFEATPASVPAATLDETGYEQRRTEEATVERTFEAAGRSQDVVVTNWQAEYDRAVDLAELGLPVDQRQQAAVFTVLSTPQVEVLGRTFNPVGEMDADELAGMVQDRYDDAGRLDHVGDATATVAGESATVGEFETEAELVETGQGIDLTLHVSEAVPSGEDFLVAVGGYPSLLQTAEREHIFTMMDAVEHDG